MIEYLFGFGSASLMWAFVFVGKGIQHRRELQANNKYWNAETRRLQR